MNASSLFSPPVRWLGLACIPEQRRIAGRRFLVVVFFFSSPVSCFSSGPVTFLSLWLLRILFPEPPVTQGSVLSTVKDKEIQKSSSSQTVSQSVTWTGEIKNYKVHGKLIKAMLWTWVLGIALILSSPGPSFLFGRILRVGPMICRFPCCSEI